MFQTDSPASKVLELVQQIVGTAILISMRGVGICGVFAFVGFQFLIKDNQ